MLDPQLGEAARVLRGRLLREPGVVLHEDVDRLWVEASPGGFEVSLGADGRELTISGGGWHDHCQDADEAADMFMWLLSSRARIVATAYGGEEYAWRFEIDEGGWKTVSKLGLALPRPFWRRKESVVRQNRWLD